MNSGEDLDCRLTAADRRFLARLPVVRRMRNLSQADLAEAAGLASNQNISRLELGQRGLFLGEALAIADALGFSLMEMVQEEPLIFVTETRIP